MQPKPPVQVLAAASLLLLATIGALVVWAVCISAIGGNIHSIYGFLSHPWFSVPLAIELFFTISVCVLVVRGWRFARIAVVVALLFWVPDLLPTADRVASEPNYPLGPWLAWFVVATHLAALALLFSKPAAPWFKQHRSRPIGNA